MRIIFIILMVVHGLIHLMGFLKAFSIAEIEQLTKSILKPAGIIWLFTAILFIVSLLSFLLNKDWWWAVGVLAVITSQMLIFVYWKDARFGTIANIIILVPIVVTFTGNLPSSYKNIFKNEVKIGLSRYKTQEILTEKDIKDLPEPVRKYIRYSGAIGKEKVLNFRAVFNGLIKPKPDSKFLDFYSVQYNFFDKPTRAFFIESKMLGIPFDGLHLYKGPSATMKIKIASLIQIVDAKGLEMNKGETVTMLNDMCVMTPAVLIDKNIEWQLIDDLTVKAKFSNQGNTITATLYFNKKGELINFSSDDRYESADGKTYNSYKWTTPLKNYRDFNGRKVATYGELIWHKPGGEFCYGKFDLVDIESNCNEFK